VCSSDLWKNIAAAPINPFWHKDSIELMPGRYAVPTSQGVEVLRVAERLLGS
jgi:hypothetical protein